MQKSFSVPWFAIQTILQLEGDVYTPGPAQEGMTELINLLSAAGSPAQDLFEGRDNLDSIEYATISKNNAFAISIRHPEVSSDGTPEDWQTFLIGNVVDLGDHLPEESLYEKQPIFVLSGQIINNGEDFLIRDMICRLPTPPSDEMVNWASPENQDSVKAMLIYGHRALTDLIQNDPLDLEALESTLNTPRYNVDEEFQDICQPATPSILYIDLCRAFQVANEDYYSQKYFEPSSPEITLAATIFQRLGMSAGTHLGSGSSVQNVTLHTHTNDRDQYAFIFEYNLPLNDGNLSHHLCVLLCKDIKGDKGNIIGQTVYGAFDGTLIGDNFIPTGIRCSYSESVSPRAINLNDPDAVRAAFWYMDGVFTHILAKRDVDIEKLVKRLNPENKNATERALSRIFERSAQNLREEVRLLQEKPQSSGAPKLELVDGRRFMRPNNPGCPWIETRRLN